MKQWDLKTPAGKIELALKTLRTTVAAVDSQWTDQARRQFEDTHLSAIEPNVRNILDAIGQLDEVLQTAMRQCSSGEE
ncbi:MAG: WXG100 family type VII secretion target [Thermoguttaceae bacterium]